MFNIKTIASTVAAASLVSVIGLAYAQNSGQYPATTGTPNDSSVQSPSNQGNTSTQGNETMPNNNTSTQGNTTMPNSNTGTERSTVSSDDYMQTDGSTDREPRADRN